MMQSALDDPIAALESQPAQRVQLLQSQTADQIHRFGGLLTFAPHPPPQARNQARSGKAHLLRRDFLAFQESNLTPAAIDFARQGAGLRRGPRGKISPASIRWPGFGPVPSGCS